MARRRMLMATNNKYTQPLKFGMERRVVFTLCQDYHSILLSKKFRKKDPRIRDLIDQILRLMKKVDYLEITNADE